MSDPTMSSGTTPVDESKKTPGVTALIKRLSLIWRNHQKKGIEVRYRIGELLNKKLGSERQKYAKSVVKRVAIELGINATNVCRFQRFAEKFATYEAFCDQHPTVTSWTGVRDLITESRKPVSGGRRDFALVRSLQSAVASFKSPEPFDSSKAEEISRLLQELFNAASCREEVRMPEHNEMIQVAS
ncbi:DUF1016 domain-containing protein [Lignipirellula cremea]|uniref:Uncharacterized protein n=1 Tax=Lignipirellula cremea TaxID=2528010 RepID=A0A518DWM2_9BACT|nr:DUF1016 domain-containing protein [Lignipirellula cremea]QDU96232.1 hypothetical protein Pla8534_40510 [Lignipirellula cremea]